MRKSTIKLTKHELDLASDTIYPETKQAVMLKMQQLFVDCGQKLHQNQLYQDVTGTAHVKISRGEHYKQMPYMVLDYPQIKGPEVTFVMRTLFWWGHYFSCNLIVHTAQLGSLQQGAAIRTLRKTYLLTGDDLWEQEVKSEQYRKCSRLDEAEIDAVLQNHRYLKLSRTIALRNYASLPERVDAIYSEWMNVLDIKKGAD